MILCNMESLISYCLFYHNRKKEYVEKVSITYSINIDKLFFINKLLTNKSFFVHFMLYINCFCSYLYRSGMQIEISTCIVGNRYALFSQFVLNQVHTISSCVQHLFCNQKHVSYKVTVVEFHAVRSKRSDIKKSATYRTPDIIARS